MAEILVVNAGSSSIKVALFGVPTGAGLQPGLSGEVTEIGGAAELRIGQVRVPCDAPDHKAALAACLAALKLRGVEPGALQAAAHRVVHGGSALVAPCRITPAVVAQIEACVPLAPLHNPANLAAIRALGTLVPGLAQYASFDTAFHATMPDVAARYALPPEAEALGLRRFGFHGISYAGLVTRLPGLTGAPLPRRLLALHLGNGASLCAILDGRSVATTMGYSPLEGLTMGTRSGDIDGNAVLRLAQVHGIDGAARILNRESGLLGLGGASDMRALLAADTDAARFAVAHFCASVVRHAGAMIAAMGGLDAVVFTAGIGEKAAAVRTEILTSLAWAGVEFCSIANEQNDFLLNSGKSKIAVWIVRAEEEVQIAAEALEVRGREA